VKRAAVALRAFIDRLVADTGLAGAFLIAATIGLMVGASYVSPAGPWFAFGGVCFAAWYVLAVPTRTR